MMKTTILDPASSLVLRVGHSAELDPAELVAARALLDRAFRDDFGDHDWEHALGGVHALVWQGAKLVAHGSVVQRRVLHAGRALRTGYVEAVGVHPDRQRSGLGSAIMGALEDVVARAYVIGALSASDTGAAFYAARGWLPWLGPTSVLGPDGLVRTPEEDGGVFVWPAADLDRTGAIACDWRDGDAW